ncbi:MAG: MFS transporter [Chloroflexota bacterium]|nr:MFS transporter [Chloroflexota bacterium]
MNPTTIAATETHKSSFFINRNFAFLWGGQAVSNVGDVVFDTTLMLWVATIIARNQPWAPLASSGVLLSAAIPTFLIGPIAGVFVDRWDKRRNMLFMDAIRAVLALLLLSVTGVIPLAFLQAGRLPAFWQLGIIYTITFLATICAQFFNPARFTLIGDVVEPAQRAHASALGQVTSNTAVVIGPFLAAPLLFVVGIQWALILNAVSFAVSFLAVLAVRLPPIVEQATPTQRASFLSELSEGLRFFAQNRLVVIILISASIAALGVGALSTLDVFFVIENLHTPASFYGLLGTAFGSGSILGAIGATFFIKRFGVIRTFWLGLMVGGLLILLFARQTYFPLALAIFFVLGMPIVAVNTAIGPLMLHIIPRHLLGRVISVFTPAMSMISILSILLAGYLAGTVLRGFHVVLLGVTWGRIDTIFTGTGLIVILGGIYALVNMRGMRMDEPEPGTKTTETEAGA